MATDNKSIIWSFLKSKGLTDNAVAGIMGNLQTESGCLPNNLENKYNISLGYSDDKYTSLVDSGKYTNFVNDRAGYGIAQWTYSSRKQDLLNFARSKGTSIADLNMQLEFLWQEMNSSTFKAVGLVDKLNQATTVQQATNIFFDIFERGKTDVLPDSDGAYNKEIRGESARGFFYAFSTNKNSQLYMDSEVSSKQNSLQVLKQSSENISNRQSQITTTSVPTRTETLTTKSIVDGTIEELLFQELAQLDSINSRDPVTGRPATSGEMLSKYTTRLFGAPFQLLDSVDHRFPKINPQVGNEYLRNFLLRSPILYIRPGMPRFTANSSDGFLKNLYLTKDFGKSLFSSIAKDFIFKDGKRLQRRMYGFRECFADYMSYVNYLCRSVAYYMGIDETMGTFANSADSSGLVYTPFSSMRWENYRMFNTYVKSPREYLEGLFTGVVNDVNNIFQSIGDAVNNLTRRIETTLLEGGFYDSMNNVSDIMINDNIAESTENREYNKTIKDIKEKIDNSWNDVNQAEGILSTYESKVTSVAFMVEPGTFSERLQNGIGRSIIHEMVDNVGNGIGSEIAFLTGANVGGVAGDVAEDLMNLVTNSVNDLNAKLSEIIQPITGGFVHSLVSGALGTLKGEKMIYPEIYKSSNSEMDYTFTVRLTSPYGDNYNYYMNIVVPLMHLIALAAPRMVSSNSTTSPFLVQAYIPGICSCQLGMITSMEIRKADNKHVSVHGYPLSIEVQFTISELYNSLSISPANDPVSFLFNETLNDYLSNLAGMIPSISVAKAKIERDVAALDQYLGGGGWIEDGTNTITGYIEDKLLNFF